MGSGGRKRVWYKARCMSRRGCSLALLAILALQLVGGIALATVCLDPCPDDDAGRSCPPTCALCTTCTHAQPALLHDVSASVPSLPAARVVATERWAETSEHSSDIFHVPLAG